MGEQPRRVAAAFDDSREADRAKARLAAEHGDHAVEENAPADEDLAFAPTHDRGDSAERPPDVTVAVELPGNKIDEDVIGLVDDCAEIGQIGQIQPIDETDQIRYRRQR